jgi:hypothetical protein
MSIIICRFSDRIEDMRRNDQRRPVAVLRVLDKCKRFSVFEATGNAVIARTMTNLFDRGYVKSIGGAFPWTEVEITEAGRKLMQAEA